MSNRNTRLFAALAAFTLLAALVPGSSAQETTSGAAKGRVYDFASGQGIPDARVTVANNDTGSQRTFTTNADGWYTATSLITGQYNISATASGYEKIPNSSASVIPNFRVDLART